MAITASQKTRLGIFVILGMIILAAFIIIPIWTKLSYQTKTYYTYFEDESLQGLENGASVKYNGVNIGRVERVDYSPEEIGKMRVTMSINEKFPMRVDMTVATGLVGITGLKYVEISGGSTEAERLPEFGVIPVRQTFFGKIGDKLDGFLEQVETLLTHLTVVTNPDSLRSVMVAIDNLADLTGDAKEMFKDIRRVVPEVREVIDTVQIAINEAAKIMRGVSEVTETVKGIAATVSQGVSASDIPGLMAHIDSTVASIKVLTDNVAMTISQTREDFSVTMENLRDATESANQLMRMLAENPSLLIRGDVRERDRR